MKSGAGGNWRRFDEKFDASIIKQNIGVSCLSALGEMFLKGRGISVSQEVIRDIIGEPAYIESLARVLNRFDISDDGLVWRGFPTDNKSLEYLLRHHKNWGIILIDSYLDKIGHAVLFAGRTRRGNSKMDSRYRIEILEFDKIRGEKYHLVFRIENILLDYNVNIIDRDGVFGVEMPSELGLKLREFPFSHKEIVNAVKPVYDELFSKQPQVA